MIKECAHTLAMVKLAIDLYIFLQKKLFSKGPTTFTDIIELVQLLHFPTGGDGKESFRSINIFRETIGTKRAGSTVP
jgi:hypothetical protein